MRRTGWSDPSRRVAVSVVDPTCGRCRSAPEPETARRATCAAEPPATDAEQAEGSGHRRLRARRDVGEDARRHSPTAVDPEVAPGVPAPATSSRWRVAGPSPTPKRLRRDKQAPARIGHVRGEAGSEPEGGEGLGPFVVPAGSGRARGRGQPGVQRWRARRTELRRRKPAGRSPGPSLPAPDRDLRDPVAFSDVGA